MKHKNGEGYQDATAGEAIDIVVNTEPVIEMIKITIHVKGDEKDEIQE